MHIKRASLEEVRDKALPILIAGYNKRKSLRAPTEQAIRIKEKNDRDRKHPTKPHLSPI